MYDYIIVSKSLNGNKFKTDLIKALNPVAAKLEFLKNNRDKNKNVLYQALSHTLKNFDYPTFFCLTIFPT